MPFLLLLLLAVVLVGDTWPPPVWETPATPDFLMLSSPTWLGVAILIASAYFIALWTQRTIQRDPYDREHVLQRYATLRLYHLAGLFIHYGLALYILGWGWVVQGLCTPSRPPGSVDPPEMFPGAELLILAPFLAALVGSWACFYKAEKAFHDTATWRVRSFWSRRAYVAFQLRQNLALIIAPLGLMIVQRALQRAFPDAGFIIALCLVPAVFIGLPWILRIVLGLKPLPEGALRDRLFQAARRLKFRFSNILVWNTNGGVVNAMVAGVIPWPRYVLLTDRLVNELPPEEVEAVFGHEVGHVRHYHMIYYASFLIGSMLAVGWFFTLATDAIPALKDLFAQNEAWASVPVVGILGAYIFVVFGFLSRRCERQADIYGCRTVSCARDDCLYHTEGTPLPAGASNLCPTGIGIFIEALEKVARLNGISRNRPGWLQSWQHSTIARRVDFLQQLLVDPSLERRFQRRVRRVKWALFVVLASVFLVLAAVHFGEDVAAWARGLVSVRYSP
jgi:Zn-dependent protease with chaperone function